MIIVSQDKKRIVNFKNITDINIEFIHSDYELRVSFIGECESFNIGNYEEEERAKEVLQEIYKNYADFELIRCIDDDFQQHLIVGNKNKYFDIYEMPED